MENRFSREKAAAPASNLDQQLCYTAIRTATRKAADRIFSLEGYRKAITMKRTMLFATLLALLTTVGAKAQQNLPSGTEIKVRTDTSIPAKPPANAHYSASVS